MEDRQEIIKALELIKNICKKHENCNTCPLGTYDKCCMIQDRNPEDWKINDTNQIWRAFN